MNRNNLKKYAPEARRDFIRAVTDRASYYGLTAKKTEPVTIQGDIAIISGRVFPKKLADQRKRLEDRIRRQGFDQVMEAMAYTWFNRLVAIRYMELHGYLDHGYRVLSHPEGGATPEIVEHAEHVDLPGLDKEKVVCLKLEGTKEAELYRMLLVAQCNALHSAMPFLFERIDDETELLLPDNLLHSDSLIRTLVNEIPEEDWQEVEIVGWLYQFYISEKKDEVIGKVVESEDIPAATQLFTPNWIVKYLLQNTLGRQWIATYPNSPLKAQMEYYIEPAEQTPEVQEQLKAITPDSLAPEELTLLDPACGSGHILVEAYDLLKAIYQERGYRAKDIPRLILEKNLFGLEIDDRAAQLAAFALMMKARADDRRLLDSQIQPHIVPVQESTGLDALEITEMLNAPLAQESDVPSPIGHTEIHTLLTLFDNARTFGFLIRIPDALTPKLSQIAHRVDHVARSGGMLARACMHGFGRIVQQSILLARRFSAVCTNPPYLNRKYTTADFKEFLQQKYESASTDVFAAFIDRSIDVAEEGRGRLGFVTPFHWMFNGSYGDFRSRLLARTTITTLVQLEYNSFSPACVPVCVFTFANARSPLSGTFINLSDFKGADCQPVKTLEAVRSRSCPWRHEASSNVFEDLPGKPIGYWVSERLAEVFRTRRPICDIADAKQGLSTSDTDRFLRRWYEVAYTDIAFGVRTREEAVATGRSWFPHCKGGGVRRWYGNHEWVIDWKNDGEHLRAFSKAVLRNQGYYFRPGITWCDLTSSVFTARLLPNGFVFDTAGPVMFPKGGGFRQGTLAYLNSSVFQSLIDVVVQGLHYTNGVVAGVPIPDGEVLEAMGCNEERLVSIFAADWSENETSWEFTDNPLMRLRQQCTTIQNCQEEYEASVIARRQEAIRLEKEINQHFISQLGLHRLSADVADETVSLYRPDVKEDVRRLISYAIGCMMGRYSLDQPGLVYAHGGSTKLDGGQYRSFPADEDGIIPLTNQEWFDDDAAIRLEQFIATAWPKKDLEANLKFISDNIGSGRDERPHETIRRYLAMGFFRHHLSLYKKRPIYWLLSSGRHRAFQCLVYLHRYNEGTLSRVRTEYVIPLAGKMTSRINRLESDIVAAHTSSHRKRMEKEQEVLIGERQELQAFDEQLRHYADRRIMLALDDGVKANYSKFGDLLAEVKTVLG